MHGTEYNRGQKILTGRIFHIVRCFKSDNYFIIREKNILQSQKKQTSKGFLFSLKENSELVRCYFDDSRELIRLKEDNYKNLVNFNLS